MILKNYLPLSFFAFLLFTGGSLRAQTSPEEATCFELRIYHIENPQQAGRMDNYLSEALLPGLHRLGYPSIGVFKPRQGQAGADSMIYVLIPHGSAGQFASLESRLLSDGDYPGMAADCLDAAHDSPAYSRMERMMLKGFDAFPNLGLPELKGPRSDRVYELRSYESATEVLAGKKVEMFNKGEAGIFIRLGFQPVFFGELISGSGMPRLLYMTTHENEAEQKEHWGAFVKDQLWERMKVDPYYANTVSHIDKFMLFPTEYSDY